MGMLVSANISMIWACISRMQYHSLTPSRTVRRLHKAQTGNKQLKQISQDKHSDIHEARAGIVLHVSVCAYAFYLSPSSQSSDNTEGKRKVQVYFCYWGWGWGKTLIKAGLAGTTPNETLLKISLTWPSWVAMHVRSLTFRCACKHAQAQYDTKLAIKSTTVRLANTYSFL